MTAYILQAAVFFNLFMAGSQPTECTFGRICMSIDKFDWFVSVAMIK